MANIADGIIKSLKDAGVQSLFGLPGGGSNADIVEAAGEANFPFIMAQTESGATFMATAQAEITGKAGACLATLGPGAASSINGVANAYLDRVPLLALTDCHNSNLQELMEHQTLDQTELFRPVTKWTVRLKPNQIEQTLARAAALAVEPRPGPVHLDCSAEVTNANLPESVSSGNQALAGDGRAENTQNLLSPALEDLLRKARRPLALVGLEARNGPGAGVIQAFCERHNLPALVTYKAKGVIPDESRCFAGVLTNGALEQPVLEKADLFIGLGLDPVELLPKTWKYIQPLVSCNSYLIEQRQLPVAARLAGEISQQLACLDAYLPVGNDWDFNWLAQKLEAQRTAMQPPDHSEGLLPHRVVSIVAEALAGARITVDAGAHMFPVMALWPAREPAGVLISNGLATMGFGLPAAIGAALLDPSRPVVAFTGDGGLLICLSELKTAVREKLPIRVIVFDDEELSLIKVKQEQRGYRTHGVSLGRTNWLAIGEAFGLKAQQAATEVELERCLAEIVSYPGPVLVAAKIDPQSYRPMIRSLRG